MRLFLAIGEKVLDSILLDPEKVKDDDYVASLRRLLLVKHEMSILAHVQQPTFYIQVHADFHRLKKKEK